MGVSYARLHPTWKTILSNLPRVAANYGVRYRVTSAYRSTAKQAKLYAAYVSGQSRYPVARPGTSQHEKGLAVDIASDNPAKLASLLAQAGVYWAGPADIVHFQLTPLKSQTTDIFEDYASNVGRNIPSALSYLPVIGSTIGAIRDPIESVKKSESTLWDILFGWL